MRKCLRLRRSDNEDSGASSSSMISVNKNHRRVYIGSPRVDGYGSDSPQEARSNKCNVHHYKYLKQTYYDRKHERDRKRKDRRELENKDSCPRCQQEAAGRMDPGSSVFTSSSSCMSARCRNRHRRSFESPRPSRCPQLLVAKCSSMRPDYSLYNSSKYPKTAIPPERCPSFMSAKMLPYPKFKGMPPICMQKCMISPKCSKMMLPYGKSKYREMPSCMDRGQLRCSADTMTHYMEVMSPSYCCGGSAPRGTRRKKPSFYRSRERITCADASVGAEVSDCGQSDDGVYYPVYFYDYPRPCDWSCSHRGRRLPKRYAQQRKPRTVVVPKKTVPSRPICPMLKSYYRDLLNSALPTLEYQCNFCQSS